jgi:L-seryl-tRNA(Ser) seleniumtransferase
VVDALRDSIIAGEPVSESDLEVESVVDAVLEEVKRMTEPTLKRVINATGVVLHTNLGRSPLSKRALKAVTDTSTGYCNLEYRLGSGERASRQEHVGLLERLTGAEAGFVVNNNAAAVLLCLTALASGREVVVSRGQLVEIGDSFRLPDIMRESGAKLVEVGTTNITRASDFANAIGEDTALLMRVHESNYRMVGYASQVPLEELVEVGRAHSVPVVEDLGSGSLIDLTPFGLPGEPMVSESVSKGADLVTFSGDKLLGGPQAGIIVGGARYVEALRSHPLARALRVDKMTLAALEATLIDYLDEERVIARLPSLKMLTESEDDVRQKAAKLGRSLARRKLEGLSWSMVRDMSMAGGGSLPATGIPTYCLVLEHDFLDAEALQSALRHHEPPVISRVKDEALLLDMRTVEAGEVGELAEAVAAVVSGSENL